MSTEYFFKCIKCQESGGEFTRQAWGWGNFYVIETFKFIAYHTDKCGAESIRIVNADEVETKTNSHENRLDFLRKTKDYFPSFETEFIGKEINNIDDARNAWFEYELEQTMKSLEFVKNLEHENDSSIE